MLAVLDSSFCVLGNLIFFQYYKNTQAKNLKVHINNNFLIPFCIFVYLATSRAAKFLLIFVILQLFLDNPEIWQWNEILLNIKRYKETINVKLFS